MHLLSIQTGISRPSTVATNKATAIIKESVDDAYISSEGVGDDVIVDQQNHGGLDQAVYIYTQNDYEFWEQELARTLPPGFFGENLTFSTDDCVAANKVRIGDRYTIGGLVLEVTAPRIPCNILADRVGKSDYVAAFRDADRPGMYCRVLTPGSVKPGDPITVESASDTNLALIDAYRLFYNRSANLDTIRQAMQSPVSIRFRQDYERRLARGE